MFTPPAVWVFSDIFFHERDVGGGGLTDGAREGSIPSPGFPVRSPVKCIVRIQKLKISFLSSCEQSENKRFLLLFVSSAALNPPHLSLSPYGVFLERLSFPHPSVSKSRIKGAYSFSFPPLLPGFFPPGRSERTEVEQLLFGVRRRRQNGLKTGTADRCPRCFSSFVRPARPSGALCSVWLLALSFGGKAVKLRWAED